LHNHFTNQSVNSEQILMKFNSMPIVYCFIIESGRQTWLKYLLMQWKTDLGLFKYI